MSDGAALTIDRPALEQLAALLLERAGLKITPDGYYGLRLALAARMPALGLSDASEYVRRLKQLAGEQELRSLLPLVTVGKTEFFRDNKQMLAFENEVLPQVLLNARREQRQVKIWSAGCATGEEPYSIGMAAIEKGAFAQEVDVWATDLNPVAVESASKGRYPARRLVGVSEERLARFFHRDGDTYEVNAEVRQLIRFEGHNLAAPVWSHVRPASLDIIFCRNVIIYFDVPTIVGVMQRFHDSLRPNGWLLLGYSESLFKVASRFDMVEVGGVFAYRRAPPGEWRNLRTLEDFIGRPSPGPKPQSQRRAPQAPSPLPPPTLSAPRVPQNSPNAPTGALTLQPPGPAASAPPPPAPQPSASAPTPTLATPTQTPIARLGEVIRAIEGGDFPKALRLATRLVDDVPDDLAARLTLGNVHALMSNLEEAQECYGAALQREPLCVEARVYMALAALQCNELEKAKQELTRALFLEPGLALGHYLLGQVNEQRKDHEAARRSYRNAVALKKAPQYPLVGHFPDLPKSSEGISQAAQYRLAALSER